MKIELSSLQDLFFNISNIIKILESRDSIKGEFAVAVTPCMVSDDDNSEED